MREAIIQLDYANIQRVNSSGFMDGIGGAAGQGRAIG